MRRNWLLWGGCGIMVAAGAYWLWRSGYQNLLGYAIFLLCPLLHLVMHRGHGHHDHQTAKGSGSPEADRPTEGRRPSCH